MVEIPLSIALICVTVLLYQREQRRELQSHDKKEFEDLKSKVEALRVSQGFKRG